MFDSYKLLFLTVMTQFQEFTAISQEIVPQCVIFTLWFWYELNKNIFCDF